jgi:hypothetical protein
LHEERGQQAANITLGNVLKIKIIIGNQGRRGLSHMLDVFDDGRANQQYGLLRAKMLENYLPKDTLAAASCEVEKKLLVTKINMMGEAYGCHVSKVRNHSSSILRMFHLVQTMWRFRRDGHCTQYYG